MVAFENGGIYEVLLAGVVAITVLALSKRLRAPGDSLGRCSVCSPLGASSCFLRSDSPELALGLSNAQWTSVVLLVAAIAGRTASVALRRRRLALEV